MILGGNMGKYFDKKNIIMVTINENDLMSFLVKMDMDDLGQPLFPLNDLTHEVIKVIPEYVFAHYEEPNADQTTWVSYIAEAAHSIYKIKEFELMNKVYCANNVNERNAAEKELESMPFRNRGEFGEILLHMLLRDFKNTIPLISKVYFKDSSNVPAHGFDAVHISSKEKILWLGESKVYTNGKQGLDALVDDLEKHLKRDYLNTQFLLIKKNLKNNNIPQRDEWIKILLEAGTLQEKLKIINIPMLCVYEYDIYEKFFDTTSLDASKYHVDNIRDLKKYFDNKNKTPLSSKCNIILMLFPIKNKYEFVKKLHEKLWHMQSL